MNLLSLSKQTTGPDFVPCTQETLDQLWHEAEQIGTVEVDCPWHQRIYEVSIIWTRKSGSRIHAKGKDSSIHVALANAINEAREMGGGHTG